MASAVTLISIEESHMNNYQEQTYLWLPSSKTPPADSLTLPDRRVPKRIWSLLYFRSKELAPPKKLPLVHGDTALLESPMHDYRISGNQLIYRGSFSEGGVWLALEYDES